MRYLFRAPVYPVVFKAGAGAVCAGTERELQSYLQRNATKLEVECALIDFRWEGWVLYPNENLVSPMTSKKRYSKREFLLFCGISDEQLAITNLNRYSREQIFDYVIYEAHRKA